jgi:hydroxymethylpyrimidine/phosphomethylpyrimidine kinase
MRTALVIAGSDPTGGAGLELDLRVLEHHGVHGMAVATALTLQDTERVHAAGVLDAEDVAARLAVLLRSVAPHVVKLGMLGSAAIVDAVAGALARLAPATPIVIDPVVRSTSGRELLEAAGIRALRERLVPKADVLTPNASEARALLGGAPGEPAALAAALGSLGARCVVVTGGDGGGEAAVDHVWTADRAWTLSAPRTAGPSPHGTGCAFAAAIAAQLAHGRSLESALESAKAFVSAAIGRAEYLPPAAGSRGGARRFLALRAPAESDQTPRTSRT